MTFQVLLNVIVAIAWMLFHNKWSAVTFFVGYGVGAVFIFLLQRFFNQPFYGSKLWTSGRLVQLFIVELVKSTFVVIREVIRPRLTIRPGIYRVSTKLESDWEISLLSALITLTPGSVVMEVDKERGVLYLHAMDAEVFRKSVMGSKRIFEKAISEVSK